MDRAILLLALAALNSGISLRLVEPMLPNLAEVFGVGVPSAAATITAFALASAAGPYFHGPAGDRFGKLRMSTFLCVGSGLASFGCATASSLDQLVAWRFLTGLFSSGTMGLGVAYLADVIPAERRQPALARYVSGTIIGQALGPFVGGITIDLVGWRGAFVVLGAVFAIVAVVLWTMTRADWDRLKRVDVSLISPRSHLAIMRRPRARAVLLCVFIETIFFFGAFSFLGAYLKARFDLPYTTIGLMLAGFGVGGVMYILAVRWLLARFGQRGCVQAGGVVVLAALTGLALIPIWPPLFLCTTLLGFGFYLCHNTLQMKATEIAPESRSTGVALFSMHWSLGQAIGVALMGLAVSSVGYAPALIGFGLGFLLLATMVRLNLTRL